MQRRLRHQVERVAHGGRDVVPVPRPARSGTARCPPGRHVCGAGPGPAGRHGIDRLDLWLSSAWSGARPRAAGQAARRRAERSWIAPSQAARLRAARPQMRLCAERIGLAAEGAARPARLRAARARGACRDAPGAAPGAGPRFPWRSRVRAGCAGHVGIELRGDPGRAPACRTARWLRVRGHVAPGRREPERGDRPAGWRASSMPGRTRPLAGRPGPEPPARMVRAPRRQQAQRWARPPARDAGTGSARAPDDRPESAARSSARSGRRGAGRRGPGR